eukprot:2372532-Ditylum_brightwellii.AAC.1
MAAWWRIEVSFHQLQEERAKAGSDKVGYTKIVWAMSPNTQEFNEKHTIQCLTTCFWMTGRNNWGNTSELHHFVSYRRT